MKRNGDADRGERLRVMTIFVLLGCVALGLLLRIAQLQLPNSGQALAAVLKHSETDMPLPSPRGTVLDRHGSPLAYDRPVCECRAEVVLPLRSSDSFDVLAEARNHLLQDLSTALGKDPALRDDPAALRSIGRQLAWRLDRKIDLAHARLKADGRLMRERSLTVDFLVAPSLDSEMVLAALRRLDQGYASNRRGYRLYLHLKPKFERVYPDRRLTAGLAGFTKFDQSAGWQVLDQRIGVAGLERLSILEPGRPGKMSWRLDSRKRSFWKEGLILPEQPVVLHSTLDLELQREAQEQLQSAVRKVIGKYGSPPEWGAMLLVEVASGDILAAASYQAGPDGENQIYGAFAPTQCVFPPGSVVKPLHIALGLERGKLDWHQKIDCSRGYRCRYHRASREIRDSHDSSWLTPYGVILNSSNIGAVQLGLLSGSEVLEEYVERFQLGTSTCLHFPGESVGWRPETPIPELILAEQLVWTGPSLCFGYALKTTPLQIARAYLTLISGQRRELRLVSRVSMASGIERELPIDRGEPFLSPLSVARVKSAMVGIMNGEEGGTARSLALSLRQQGVPPGLLAGKTGTSEFKGRIELPGEEAKVVEIRTASFVAFAPVDEPELLVLCVLQKAGAELFYGGSYAAPAAVRLLLTGRSRRQEELRSGRREQVRVRADGQAWNPTVPVNHEGGR